MYWFAITIDSLLVGYHSGWVNTRCVAGRGAMSGGLDEGLERGRLALDSGAPTADVAGGVGGHHFHFKACGALDEGVGVGLD